MVSDMSPGPDPMSSPPMSPLEFEQLKAEAAKKELATAKANPPVLTNLQRMQYALLWMVWQVMGGNPCDEGQEVFSEFISAYADALRSLGENGLMEIEDRGGRVVYGKLTDAGKALLNI